VWNGGEGASFGSACEHVYASGILDLGLILASRVGLVNLITSIIFYPSSQKPTNAVESSAFKLNQLSVICH